MQISHVFKVYVRVKRDGLASKDVDLIVDAHAPLLADVLGDFELKAIGAHMPYCVFVFRFHKTPWQVQGFIRAVNEMFQSNEFLEVILIEPSEKGYEDIQVTHRSMHGTVELLQPLPALQP